jgi:hypothetical protein
MFPEQVLLFPTRVRISLTLRRYTASHGLTAFAGIGIARIFLNASFGKNQPVSRRQIILNRQDARRL